MIGLLEQGRFRFEVIMNIGTDSTAHGSRLENCQPELSLQIPDYFVGRFIVIRQARFPFNNAS
ncbi:MAG: hypothetical protein DMG57_13230 [Acidobacteria bacterium]|nr:MAG: hypothetical protein DMG57_13230 [Acidobacteriota bacterium]